MPSKQAKRKRTGKGRTGKAAKKKSRLQKKVSDDDELGPEASVSTFSNASLQNYRRWLALQREGKVGEVLPTMEGGASAPPHGGDLMHPELSESSDSDDFGSIRGTAPSSGRKRKPMWDESGRSQA